jgi:hypothetical protein
MRYDFTYIQAVQSAARRERAEAVHRLILAPLIGLLVRLSTSSGPRHAARAHLARQG